MTTIMNQNLYPGLAASADLSAKAYHVAKISGANTVTFATAGEGFGILQNAPASGETAQVAVSGGGALAKAGSGGWSAGEPLKSAADGTLIVADTDGDKVIATAITAASAGDVAEVFVDVQYLFVGA